MTHLGLRKKQSRRPESAWSGICRIGIPEARRDAREKRSVPVRGTEAEAERYMSKQESARSGSGNCTRDYPVAHIHTWAVKRSKLEA